jgi:hypothetical protein
MRYKLTAVNLYGKTEMAMGQLWLPLLPGCNRTIVRFFNKSAELPGPNSELRAGDYAACLTIVWVCVCSAESL